MINSTSIRIGVPVDATGTCKECAIAKVAQKYGITDEDSYLVNDTEAYHKEVKRVERYFAMPGGQVDICCQCGAGRPVAVLTTTVLPLDGTYEVRTLDIWGTPDGQLERVDQERGYSQPVDPDPFFLGVPHYVGHPSTAKIVEGWGAVKADSPLFSGLQPGEVAVVVSLRRSNRGENNRRTIDQEVSPVNLMFRIVKRIK